MKLWPSIFASNGTLRRTGRTYGVTGVVRGGLNGLPRLDEATITYFRSLSEETAIPYQSLINLYLRECAASKKHLKLVWERAPQTGAA